MTSNNNNSSERWDTFISHASEDKDKVARPIAEKLRSLGYDVWYDEFMLTLGDSLSESIDRGLAKSRYAVVVLSPSFFSKRWPKRELNGLASREVDSGKIILPVWHNIDSSQIVEYSPTLADKVGISTVNGIDPVVNEIVNVLTSGMKTSKAVQTDEELASNSTAVRKVANQLTGPRDYNRVTITFEDPNDQKHEQLHAIITEWVDFEDVSINDLNFRTHLEFPGGTYVSGWGELPILAITDIDLPVEEIIQRLSSTYRRIEFSTDYVFNLGDLRRRSRGGIRSVIRSSPQSLTFSISESELSVGVTDDGSIVTIRSRGRYRFHHSAVFPSYRNVMKYLLDDPPDEVVREAIQDMETDWPGFGEL